MKQNLIPTLLLGLGLVVGLSSCETSMAPDMTVGAGFSKSNPTDTVVVAQDHLGSSINTKDMNAVKLPNNDGYAHAK